jgi:1-acyl-sn-glycerol-3-phosphate acyltransferase
VRFLAGFRAILFLSLVFSMVVLLGFWVILASAIFRRPVWMRHLCHLYAHTFFPLFGIKVVRKGFEKLEKDKRYLFVSNHQSFLDIMVMMGWLRFPAFLAKQEISSWPLFGWSMRQMGCVFVDRKDRRDRAKTPARVKQALQMGNDFCIFPEGTRSLDGKLLPFQAGAFHIGTEAGLTMVPVVIAGSGRVLNKRGFRLVPGTIELTILDPIDLSDGKRDHKLLAREVESLIAARLT